MRFLTKPEWQEWCVKRQVPLRDINWIRPDISAPHYHVAKLPYPQDSGKKVYLAKRLFSFVATEGEALVLVDEWDVWYTHMPLFTRFREALGERRPLIEAPGHLVDAADTDDAISVVATSLLFVWDCYGISFSGRDAFYISHDEYCFVASRDAAVVARVAAELSEA